ASARCRRPPSAVRDILCVMWSRGAMDGRAQANCGSRPTSVRLLFLGGATARRLRVRRFRTDMKPMRRLRTQVLTAVLVLAVTVRGAAGAGEPRQHGGVSHRVVTIDREQVHPSALTMKKDDVLEFVNYSAAPMMLVFIQPQDHSDTARC